MRPSLHNVSAGQAAGKVDQEPTLIHRRVEITVEREVISVFHQSSSFAGLCVQCGRDVLKLTPESAAAASGITPREIYRWIDEQKLHFDELPTGQVFVCSESLGALTHAPQRSPGEAQLKKGLSSI
jgi:hypothetical protein